MSDFGLPDFSAIDPVELEAKIRDLLAQYSDLVGAIAALEEPASVENTLVPFETGRAELDKWLNVHHTYASSVGGEAWDHADASISALLAEHDDAIFLDSRLYAKFAELAEQQLEAETAWCVSEHVKNFRAHGAHLDEAAQERLRQINLEIADLTTRFGQLVVKAQLAGSVALTEDEVAGLTDSQKAALAADAQANPELAQGKPYLIVLRLPTQQPAQAWLADPEVRKRVLNASTSRGDGHDSQTDSRQIALTLARLRAEQAEILGYPTYAEYIASQATAGSTEAIRALLLPMIEPTQRNVEAEHDELVALAGDAGFTPSDWFYLQEKLQAERFNFDTEKLAPYLELNNVVEKGIFFAANRLYGLEFIERTDLAGYAPEVRVWEVQDIDGSVIGLFLGDYYARTGKRGGAWMHDIVSRSGRGEDYTIVCNNLNLTKPADGQPTLLTWDETETAFHEFGHALHSLLSKCEWPSAAGTNVPRDFVEYPSQVNEIWARHPEVLASYARHYQTGEQLPNELLEALNAASDSGMGEGFHMSELLQAMLLDQSWHNRVLADLPESVDEVEEFEANALERLGIACAWVAPRYRTSYFNHIFAGGYSAGYYSYMWSEALDADTVDWFQNVAAKDGDGGLNREAGARMRDEVLSRGNSRNPIEGFERLRGRGVDTTALLRRHKLIS